MMGSPPGCLYSRAKLQSSDCLTYMSADSYGRYLPEVSDGVELAAAASSCLVKAEV